jgi:transcriptional regulator with XRE-family HTH domain
MEIRLARRRLGLSLQFVSRAVGISASELSRIERGLADWVSLLVLCQLCAVVGLDLSAKAYPGGPPIRDAQHRRLLGKLRLLLHSALSWSLEVPLPGPSEQRAWDALIRGAGWRYGVECELNPLDGQAVLRRLALKQRDGMVDGLILLLPETRQTRLFRREFTDELAAAFPIRSVIALKCLAVGRDPGGNAVIVL